MEVFVNSCICLGLFKDAELLQNPVVGLMIGVLGKLLASMNIHPTKLCIKLSI